jgi:pimeloyl-ACP methyl ester carboxylesterase
MLTEQSFTAGSVTINYAEGPPVGPPLVLVHGLADRWQAFLPILPTLAARWHVYALDCRGHGKSSRTPGHYQAKDYFHDLCVFLMHQLPQPAILLGHSSGGSLALALAAELPENVRGIIVSDAPLDLDHLIDVMSTLDTQHFFAQWRALAGRPAAELLPLLPEGGDAATTAETLSQVDPGVLEFHAEGRLREFFEGYPRVDLRQITCPVLLIQATPALGGLLSDQEVAHAVAVLPHAMQVRLACDHGLGLFQGDVAPFLDAVRTFLESL